MLVSKPTHGGGAPLGIDLDAGVAKIKLTRPAPAAEPATSAAEPDSGPAADRAAAEDAGPNEDHNPTR